MLVLKDMPILVQTGSHLSFYMAYKATSKSERHVNGNDFLENDESININDPYEGD